jgi:tetratricopeptide (TPR) repeat protein
LDFSKHIQKAEEALRRRNYDFAVELYRQLIDLDPDQGEARGGLRQALKKRAAEKKGGRFLRAMSGALPLSQAKAMSKLGKHAACAKALENYLATNPLDEEANLLLGVSLEEAGHLRSARAVYEFTAEIAPRNSEALKRAGAMMHAAGDHDHALEYFERALAADPRDQEALKARKNLAADMALSQSSADRVGHSRELIKDKVQAKVLEKNQRMHRSEDELREDLEGLEGRYADNPSDPEIMIEMATVHEKLKDYESALDLAERAQDYRRDSFDLVVQVGNLKSKVLKRELARADREGQADRATELEQELIAHEVQDHRRRSEIRPGDAPLRLGLGKKLIRSGDVDAALVELQRCQDEPRVKEEALFLLGQCFQRKGIYDLARKEYERALDGKGRIDDRAKEILYNLGSIAEEQGDPSEARAYYIRIYEVDISYRDVASKMTELN